MAGNLWDTPGVPHKGWVCIDMEDLGPGNYTECEMCNNDRIRYVHLMEHDEYPEQIKAGCVCASHMSGDYVGTIKREKKLKRAAGLQSRWLNRNWKISAKGNHYLKINDRIVGVYQKDILWGMWIDKEFSRPKYVDEDRAKLELLKTLIKHDLI